MQSGSVIPAGGAVDTAARLPVGPGHLSFFYLLPWAKSASRLPPLVSETGFLPFTVWGGIVLSIKQKDWSGPRFVLGGSLVSHQLCGLVK